MREILDLCLDAHQAGLEATKPGVTVSMVINAMNDVIAEGGWAEWDWSTGHGFRDGPGRGSVLGAPEPGSA